jgi:hypothetical protein
MIVPQRLDGNVSHFSQPTAESTSTSDLDGDRSLATGTLCSVSAIAPSC